MGIEDLKLPPHNKESEMGILSAILIDNSNMHHAESVLLGSNDFYHREHKAIFKAMSSVKRKGATIDAITVGAELGSSLDKVGGIDYLYELSGYLLSASGALEYANTVKEKAVYRTIINTCTEIIGKSMGGIDLDEILADVKSISNVAMATNGSGEKYIDVIGEYLSDIGTERGFICKYGFDVMDEKLSGYRPGQLIIIGARPGVGKSLTALNLAHNIISQDSPESPKNVLFFSLEMTNREIIERILCRWSGIDTNNINKKSNEEHVIAKAMENVKREDSLMMYDNLFTCQQIITEIRKRHITEGVSVVFIDYLGLMRGYGNGSRNDVIGEMTGDLKRLAQELQISIVLLSQLNRAGDGRSGEPVISNLRDSGNIEQDADVILLLYQGDKEYSPDWKKYLKVILAKQRGGEAGIPFYLGLNASTMTLYNVDQDSDEITRL